MFNALFHLPGEWFYWVSLLYGSGFFRSHGAPAGKIFEVWQPLQLELGWFCNRTETPYTWWCKLLLLHDQFSSSRSPSCYLLGIFCVLAIYATFFTFMLFLEGSGVEKSDHRTIGPRKCFESPQEWKKGTNYKKKKMEKWRKKNK